MRLAPLFALLLCAAPAAAQLPGDAYADDRAREMVRLARARRDVVDTRITAYEVTARERISARMGVLGVERLLYRRESASRIAWTPDTVRIHLLGAREVAPPVDATPDLAGAGIAGSLPSLAFDPVNAEALLRMDSTDLRNPLAPGSEAYYRFARGDSLSIRLPDGRAVRIVELRITARRPDPRLINGSFWLDSRTHAVVRAGFRLARRFSSSDDPDMPGMVPEVTGELDHIAIDYGLYDGRWWLPRSMVARGVVRMMGTRFPLAYERGYSGYTVVGDTLAEEPRAVALAGAAEGSVAARPVPCRPRTSINVQIAVGSRGSREPGAPDSAWAKSWERATGDLARGDTAAAGGKTPCRRAFLVTADTAELARSTALPGSIYEEGEGAVREEELRALAGLVRDLPGVPWSVGSPEVRFLPLEMARFNRVEGLSLGARATLALGPAELRGEVRAGTTGEVGARAAFLGSTPTLRAEVAAYRGLEAVQLASQPFSLASSAGALLLGRDENDYFRGTGAELRLAPGAARRQWWDVRLFGELQQAVRARSDVSVRNLLDGGFDVRENVRAERLTQAGATLRLRAARGDDPGALRTRAELELHGETGGACFARPLLRVGAEAPLFAGLGVGVSAAAGTGFGTLPVQRLWQIGGATTVRGHDAASLRGESVWLARAELTRGAPAFRWSVFGDAGWAGEHDAFFQARPLRGVGVGAAFLDNLVRVDLAHGLDGGGLRLHLRMGGGI
jgi:hypothetical protein